MPSIGTAITVISQRKVADFVLVVSALREEMPEEVVLAFRERGDRESLARLFAAVAPAAPRTPRQRRRMRPNGERTG